jgi:hypothetical protein
MRQGIAKYAMGILVVLFLAVILRGLVHRARNVEVLLKTHQIDKGASAVFERPPAENFGVYILLTRLEPLRTTSGPDQLAVNWHVLDANQEAVPLFRWTNYFRLPTSMPPNSKCWLTDPSNAEQFSGSMKRAIKYKLEVSFESQDVYSNGVGIQYIELTR